MRAVLLVPRRAHPDRDRLWAWARDRWRRYLPDLPIHEGHHDDGPFNRSAAINTAARRAGEWDVGIVIDADIFIRASQVRAAVEGAAAGRVTWAHRRWRGLSEDGTRAVVYARAPRDFGPEIDREDMDLLVERTTPLSWSCCVAIPRAVWEDAGGFDERFRGWGFEDMAWKSLITGLYPWGRVEGDVYHLWHPRSEERIVKGEPAITATPEYVTNARLGRRYMIAAIRDHGSGDQPGEESLSAEMREKHVRNLRRDDAKLAPIAARMGLPDWSGWWPGLDELREGAKAQRLGPRPPDPTVTVVVHTGGTSENWHERREYLRSSLASLTTRVSGPIVQRVVYSDWAPEHGPELAALAAEFGFYVAGEGNLGYTASMQRMWRYLAKRALGQYIFATEDDFTYERDVDLAAMIDTLRSNPHLRQLALLREPYYPRELDAGSVLATMRTPGELVNSRPYPFVEHRDHWTANPAVFARSLTATPWPSGTSSERVFGDIVLRDRSARFAYWGAGEPWTRHIGAVRAGTGY